MSYTKERDEFISRATGEGLSLDTCRKLLRYATTLQRLVEAQCNGDYPYNGDRDRPSREFGETPCPWCSAGNEPKTPACAEAGCNDKGMIRRETNDSAKYRKSYDARYTVCPKCEVSGVAKSAMRRSNAYVYHDCEDPEWAHCGICKRSWCDRCDPVANAALCHWCHGAGASDAPYMYLPQVCPDCRTQELVTALLAVECKERECGKADCPCANQVKPIFQGDPRGAVLRLATPGYPWSDDGSKGYGLYVPARVR